MQRLVDTAATLCGIPNTVKVTFLLGLLCMIGIMNAYTTWVCRRRASIFCRVLQSTFRSTTRISRWRRCTFTPKKRVCSRIRFV